jgi:hypothetical protein
MKYREAAIIASAAMLLATFFWPPTLEIYLGWADHIMGVTR